MTIAVDTYADELKPGPTALQRDGPPCRFEANLARGRSCRKCVPIYSSYVGHDAIKAAYKDGVPEVTIAKRPEAKAVRSEVAY